MSSVKSSRRFLPRFLRRASEHTHTSTTAHTRSNVSSAGSDAGHRRASSALRKSLSLSKLGKLAGPEEALSEARPEVPPVQSQKPEALLVHSPKLHLHSHSQATTTTTTTTTTATTANTAAASSPSPSPSPTTSPAFTRASTTTSADGERPKCPQLTLEEPTPVLQAAPTGPTPSPAALSAPAPDVTSTVVTSPVVISPVVTSPVVTSPSTSMPPMPAARKMWVRRPNASATLVHIGRDDLVDDVRDMILRKYANSLGRSFDAPDLTLRILPRDPHGHERTLGPDEHMANTLDAHYPHGQTVHDALLIDVPVRRTPKPSPRLPLYYAHHDDAQHAQTEYFPPMPAVAHPSPAPPHPPHSIAVLTNGGQLPPLPSPGGAATRRLHHTARPRVARTHTASPTTMAGGIPSSNNNIRPGRPRHDSSADADKHPQPTSAPIPTPPLPLDPPVRTQHDTPPAARVASPRPDKKKRRKPAPAEPSTLSSGLLDGSVPPINVLIVEDNIINLRVLGAFMQRLKVRWQRAMNGKEAVTKWKAGGFHLVLMDIQLPVMNGLEATKEIRRLERVNSIGVFSSGSSEAPNTRLGQQNGSDSELLEDDRLGDRSLFKSPVIIVALTASSLQSDRHEALAAGCNDFLTKPVNFVWLERKVKEWGCMQALIDFDGWRKWKDFAKDSDSAKDRDTNKMSTSMASIAPARKATAPASAPDTNASSASHDNADKKAKRRSLVHAPPAVLEEESETPTPDVESA